MFVSILPGGLRIFSVKPFQPDFLAEIMLQIPQFLLFYPDPDVYFDHHMCEGMPLSGLILRESSIDPDLF